MPFQLRSHPRIDDGCRCLIPRILLAQGCKRHRSQQNWLEERPYAHVRECTITFQSFDERRCQVQSFATLATPLTRASASTDLKSVDSASTLDRARPLLPSETGQRENQEAATDGPDSLPLACSSCGAGTGLIEAKHFVEYNGRPVSSVKTAFKSAVGLVGLGPGISPHRLRHTAAPRLMQSGADPMADSWLSGNVP